MVRYNRMFVYHYCDLKKIPIHRHDAWEIVYYEQGSGITHIGGESYNYDKNTFTVTPKEVLMNEIHHQSTTPWCVMLDVEDFPLQQGIYKDTKDLRIFKQIQKYIKNKRITAI